MLKALTSGCYFISTLALVVSKTYAEVIPFPVIDTLQTRCTQQDENCPTSGEGGYGQDAQYLGLQPSYQQNSDGTVTDINTGLMWTASIDINGDGDITAADKMTYQQAKLYAQNLTLGGYNDWRLPSIKTLYSLMLFDGQDPSGIRSNGRYSIRPFIDHSYFGFASGDLQAGERLIDSQYVSDTRYVSTTMNGDETVFGVNFIDGRIKGYGVRTPSGKEKTFYVLAVRGNSKYGENQFVSIDNESVQDKATRLTWQQGDSNKALTWQQALDYCNRLTLSGTSDWRLPNAKELQSIVDYDRSPDTTNSAAIDPIFTVSQILNEEGKIDYPNYWSSTTHWNLNNGKNAVYIAFGRSLGFMKERWLDVHGAGAQRSNPKHYNGRDYPQGHGPQGDAVRFENHVKCVRAGATFVAQPQSANRESKHYSLTSLESQSKIPNHNKRSPIGHLDRNNDGRISKSEARGPLQRDFDRIDRNSDGYISANELPKR